jgi:hypothetical protein
MSLDPSPASPTIANVRPPVPVLLGARASVVPHQVEAVGEVVAEPQKMDEPEKMDELEKRAAQIAAEMDGYKLVTILGKASNGAWRVKAYRGATEVQLIVDGTGRVSLE